MTTASIVARSGWIIPEPFAIPPTVNPPRATTASFGRVSVVMIASAASRAAVLRERRDGRVEPGQQPVQRQPRADHAGREDEHLLGVEVEQPRRLGGARERVELAALAGGRVRDAGVDHDGLRVGEREVLAVISRHAACTRLRVNIAAPVACGTERTTARSLRVASGSRPRRPRRRSPARR